jgi:hypothetical protein
MFIVNYQTVTFLMLLPLPRLEPIDAAFLSILVEQEKEIILLHETQKRSR